MSDMPLRTLVLAGTAEDASSMSASNALGNNVKQFNMGVQYVL